MDARNLHGRTESAWTHGICMDARNLHGRTTEFACWCGGDSQWRVRPELSSPTRCRVRGGGGLSVTHIRTQKQKDGWKSSCLGKGLKKKLRGGCVKKKKNRGGYKFFLGGGVKYIKIH